MSLVALKELSALDGEAKGLLQRYDDILLTKRRGFLSQIVECFAAVTEAEGFRVKHDPMGASARMQDTELAISCTDPSHILVESQAKYTITCSLAPNRSYGILLCRQPLVEFTNKSSDTNDQITNRKLEIEYYKSLIKNQSNDQWYVIGRLEATGDALAMMGGQQPQYESFQTFDQAVKTALREISNAAIAPPRSMKTSATSLSRVPANRPAQERSSLPVILALSLAVFATSCGKKQEEAAAVSVAPPPPAAPVSNINVESEITNALSGQAPAPASASDLAREAESILDKYPSKNAADLLNVPEVSPKLRNLLGKLAQDKDLQARINSSVDLAAQITGLEGAHKLDLDMKGYDRPRTSRMLQAALSEDPRQLVSFLVGEIGEATPDISYGGLVRAQNGVSIVPSPSATPKTDLPD